MEENEAMENEEVMENEKPVMSDEDKALLYVKNMVKRLGYDNVFDLPDKETIFDYAAYNNEKDETMIVGHSFVDHLTDDIPHITREQADEGIVAFGKMASDEIKSTSVIFSWVKLMVISRDENEAKVACAIVKDVPIYDDKPCAAEPEDDRNEIPGYKIRLKEEFEELSDRVAKLCLMLLKNDDELGFKLSCPRRLLREQLKSMTEYLGILYARTEIEGVEIDDSKMKRVIVLMEALDLIKRIEDGDFDKSDDEE